MKVGWEFFLMLQGLVLRNLSRDSLGPRTLDMSPEVACRVDLSWTRFWLCDLKSLSLLPLCQHQGPCASAHGYGCGLGPGRAKPSLREALPGQPLPLLRELVFMSQTSKADRDKLPRKAGVGSDCLHGARPAAPLYPSCLLCGERNAPSIIQGERAP